MNNSFSLQHIFRTDNLDPNLLSRQYKLNLMADFMRVKCENPKMKQSEIANQLGLSSSTLKRYRNDMNMLSPYRIHPNNTNKRAKKFKTTNFDNNSLHGCDPKTAQMTSNEHKMNSNEPVKNKKNKLKGGDPSDSRKDGVNLLEQAFHLIKGLSVKKLLKKTLMYKTKFHKPLKNTIKNHFQQDLKLDKML